MLDNVGWSWNLIDPENPKPYLKGSTSNAQLPDYDSAYSFSPTNEKTQTQSIQATPALGQMSLQAEGLNPVPDFQSTYKDRTQDVRTLQPNYSGTPTATLNNQPQDFSLPSLNLPSFSFDYAQLGLDNSGQPVQGQQVGGGDSSFNLSGLSSLFGNLPAMGSLLGDASVYGPMTAGEAAGSVAGQGLTGGIGLGGILAGGYTGYQQLTGLQDFFNGDKLSTQQQLALALPTFGLSLLSNVFGGGPTQEDLNREQVSNSLQGVGLLGDDFNLTLQDGTKVDFTNPGQMSNFASGNVFNPDDQYIQGLADRGTHAMYELDPTNPLTSQAVAYLNPLGEILAQQGNFNLGREKLVGWLANSILQSGTVDTEQELMDQIRAIYDQVGINNTSGIQALSGYGLDDNTFNVFGHDLNVLFR